MRRALPDSVPSRTALVVDAVFVAGWIVTLVFVPLIWLSWVAFSVIVCGVPHFVGACRRRAEWEFAGRMARHPQAKWRGRTIDYLEDGRS